MVTYRDLIVFQKAYKLAMDIFERTKKFPPEEKFSLTDQIRRSSRSVCVNFVEAYRRRKYKAHFLSKLTDSLTENAETQVWLDFSKDCSLSDPQTNTINGAPIATACSMARRLSSSADCLFTLLTEGKNPPLQSETTFIPKSSRSSFTVLRFLFSSTFRQIVIPLMPAIE